MKKIYILTAVLAVMMASCSERDIILDETHEPEKAPIVNEVNGAKNGELLVKFRPEVADVVEAQVAVVTRSGVSTRSGLPSMDEVMDIIGAYQFERVFPIDSRNEGRTRESGLHLWYSVKFSEAINLEQAAEDLARIAEVQKVQYSHILKRSYDEKKSATALTVDMMRKMYVAREVATELPYNDALLGQQWDMINRGDNSFVKNSLAGCDVQVAEAWELCAGDPNIIVAIVDEGVDFTHEDLAPNMWVNTNETLYSHEDNDNNGYAGDRYGYNFARDNGVVSFNDPNDTGHGTHVAGTVAAVGNNSVGISGVAGGSGNGDGVKLMACQVFAGNYGVTLLQEAKAIKYAADNGAVVLQCSWGYNSYLSNPMFYTQGYGSDEEWEAYCPLEKEALDYFMHNAGSPNGYIEGGVVVFAAGNESAGMSSYPGCYADYVSVEALAADFTPSSFSNYGIGCKIAAPGGDTYYHEGDNGSILSTLPKNISNTGYGYMEGTSQACPHVSGVVALAMSYAVKLHRHVKASEIQKLLYSTMTPIDGYFTDTKYYWENFGSAGAVASKDMDPSKYNGRGMGAVNATALLNAMEGIGADMHMSNMYVALDGTSKLNVSAYFKNSNALTYTCAVTDNAIAAVNVNGNMITVKGTKVGTTKASVTASNGETQSFTITVRKYAGSNGWL